MRANLDGIQKSIQDEVVRVGERAKNDYEMAQQVEVSARQVFDNGKSQANALNDKAIEYMIVRQEADQSRTLYESLLSKLKQAGVLAGLHSSNITVVDAASAPAKPAKPNVLLYLAASLAGGLFIGSCAALLRDTMDNKIQSLPDLEAYLGETPLGILPFHKENRKALPPASSSSGLPSLSGVPALLSAAPSAGFAAISQPSSPYTESLRALRTSLMLSRGGAPPKVLLVTSSVSGEGKSMLSLNLAALLAQQLQGKRVLLVDGDLRRPVLHRRLNISGEKGLSTVLTSPNIAEAALNTALPVDGVPGLDILPAGPIAPYPAELLSSEQMREALRIWRENYEFILIDGAPVLPVTDSVILSSMADLALVVARFKMTERQSLERSCRLLQQQSGQQKVGVVLNAVERTSDTYYQYYGYKYSNYYGKESNA
jgi:capsular exopolysaccharide synthesis family protein